MFRPSISYVGPLALAHSLSFRLSGAPHLGPTRARRALAGLPWGLQPPGHEYVLERRTLELPLHCVNDHSFCDGFIEQISRRERTDVWKRGSATAVASGQGEARRLTRRAEGAA